MPIKPIFIRVFTYLIISLSYLLLFLTHKLFALNEAPPANAPVLDPSQSLNDQPSTRPPTDTLTSQPSWRRLIKHQANSIQGEYNGCLFGDSISQPLHTSLGKGNSNFAVSGMSTVSLIVQLKLLISANLRCRRVIIAIGTNDAFYRIKERALIENLRRVIALAHKTRAEQIIFIPAFYASIAIERDPDMEDINKQIKEVNAVMSKIGIEHHVLVETANIEKLFIDQTLKEKLTADGIHLNQYGLNDYRTILLKIINNKKSS